MKPILRFGIPQRDTGSSNAKRRLAVYVIAASSLHIITGIPLSSTKEASAQETADWSGEWNTLWRGGGARLEFEQDGDMVTGRYPLYEGRIEARAVGQRLIGRWFQPDREGRFVFVQALDGDTFMGRFESGEWWTGIRVDAASRSRVPIDQSSPMATMRTFLRAMNESGASDLERVGKGTIDLVGTASAVVEVSEDNPMGVNRLEYTQRLFAVLDQLTFRLWDLPQGGADGQVTVTLPQAGTDVTLALDLRRIGDDWFIVGPPLDLLEAKLDELIAARGEGSRPIRDPRELRTPRDTFKTLILGLRRLGELTDNPAYATLNASELSAVVRSEEIPLAIRYLAQVLDRIGYTIWQEIPNDPASRTPYVHFEHPVGNIVIAPVETDDGVIWQFTPETLRNIRALYAAIDEMPVAPEFASSGGADLYFRIRGLVRDTMPELLPRLGILERWQWVALGLVVAGSLSLGFVVSAGFRRALWPTGTPGDVLIWSIRMIAFGLILLAFLPVLGLPEAVAPIVKAIAWVGIAIGGVAPTWWLIGYAADGYRLRWVVPGYRETLLSLITGVARFAVIIAALLVLAEALAIPYQGVLAGLGIGGLAVALAAQPTLQNFLSGLTLYGDRPVSVGDFCRFGDKLGTIEHIGMRSTQVRSLDRTVVTVPNSEFVNMQLENFAHRDRIWLSTKLQLRYETTPDQLRYVLVELRKLLIAHPKVAPDPARVRFVGFGEHSLDVDIFAYVFTTDYNEFLAISEDIFLRMMALVEEAGTQFAVPSAVHYHAEDKAMDAERVKRAEEEVAGWRNGTRLPFPDFPWQDKAELSGTLDYPPEGSSVAQEMQEWQLEDRPRREIGQQRS